MTSYEIRYQLTTCTVTMGEKFEDFTELSANAYISCYLQITNRVYIPTLLNLDRAEDDFSLKIIVRDEAPFQFADT